MQLGAQLGMPFFVIYAAVDAIHARCSFAPPRPDVRRAHVGALAPSRAARAERCIQLVIGSLHCEQDWYEMHCPEGL
jgi:hypothetical protein